MSIRRPELLIDIGERLAEQLEEKGLDRDQASDVAFDLTEFLRKHWGGSEIYFPKKSEHTLCQRDQSIYEDWRGGLDNVQMMRKYDLSVQRIGQIIRTMRASRRQRADGKALFDEAG
jgi:Mor family transcriptional regulator